MANERTCLPTDDARPSGSRASLRGLIGLVLLSLAYLSVCFGLPAPDFRAGPGTTALQSIGGQHHTLAREATRAVAAVERRDPGAPPPSPAASTLSAAALVLGPSGAGATVGPSPRGPPPAARFARAHPPRAPPEASA